MSAEFTVERVGEYSHSLAIGLGRLMPMLSERLTDEPLDEHILRHLIESPTSEVFAAKQLSSEKIVGAGVLNIVIGLSGERAILDDFVVDEEVRGNGVASTIWEDMVSWSAERGLDMEFTSRAERQDAHQFYLAKGAVIRETTVFRDGLR